MKQSKLIASIVVAIMALSTVGIMLPAIIPVNAAAAGTITVSDASFIGNKVIQVTVSDADIAGQDASPPRVTADKVLTMTNPSQVVGQLTMYQTSGGAWVGFIAITASTPPTLGAVPAQDPVTPGGTGGTFDANDTDGFAPGTEPQIGTTGTLFSGNDIICLVTVTSGDKVTLTYNDSAPAASINVDVEFTTGNAGSTSITKGTYPPGGYVYVKVTDADLNLDPTAADAIAYAASPTTNQYGLAGTGLTFATGPGSLTETGPNTGVFENAASSTQIATSVVGGTILTATYKDGAPVADRVGSSSVATNTGSITLDKTEYKISDKAVITVTDPDLNVNQKSKDSVAADGTPGATVALKTDGMLYAYSSTADTTGAGVYMLETGADTGIFEGKFTFSTTATTQGNEPILKVASNDDITALYKDDLNSLGGNTAVSTAAKFKSATGTVSLNAATYGASSIATATVTDPDLNTNPFVVDVSVVDTDNTRENAKAYVYSSADTTGTGFGLVETGQNTDTFTGSFTFGSATSAAGTAAPTIQVASGNTVTALYKDALNADGGTTDVEATALYQTTTGTISTNKASFSYISGTLATVYVTDPDRNANPAGVDTIASPATPGTTYPGLTYRIGSGGTETGAAMSETGPNTSEFKADITLTGQSRGDTLTFKYYDSENAAGNNQAISAFASCVSNTGAISLDKSVYALGSKATVTVSDPDRNLSPIAINTIDSTGTYAARTAGDVTVKSTTDSTGIPIDLTETGVDTGIFEQKITMDDVTASSGTTIDAVKGDTVTFRYYDAVDSSGASVDILASATITATTGSVSLDKSVYSSTGKVIITVNDPDMNTLSSAVDSISRTTIAIKTTSMTTTTNPDNDLAETGVDTGVFDTYFTLGASVGGTTTTVTNGDGLTVTYTEAVDATGAKDVVHSASATVTFTTGTLTFDKASYTSAESAIVTVNDPDRNANPDLINSFTVTVTSTSDPGGISLTVTETGANENTFTGTVTFSTTRTAGSQILIKDGDTLTAKYSDTTANPDDIPGWTPGIATTLTISNTATVGEAAPSIPAIPAETTGTATKDADGVAKTSFVAGATVLPSATVKNTATVNVEYLIAVQMMAPDNTVYPTNYIQTTLSGEQSFTFSPSFVLPSDAMVGDWSYEVSVFDTFPALGGTVKADPVTQTFTVA